MADSVARSDQYDASVKHRLSRIEGQIRGVLAMMEQEKECRDVVTQLTAIRSAVDRAIALVIAGNMQACVRKELAKGNSPDGVLEEGTKLLMRSR